MKKNTTRFFARTSIALAVCMTGASSLSALADDSGWYLGGNIGKTRSLIDDAKTTTDFFGTGSGITGMNLDQEDTGYKLFAGYDFNKHFALEAGYFDLRTSDTFTAGVAIPGGMLTSTFGGPTKVQGYFLDMVGKVPLNDKWALFARFGGNTAKVDERFTGTGDLAAVNYHSSATDTNIKYGAGIEYSFTPNWVARLEAERYRMQDGVANKNYINLVSLGLVYRFGRSEPAPTLVKVAAPVAAPAPATQQYCTNLEIEFEIDRDAVQRADVEKLRAVGAFMNKYPNVSGTIEGRADEVGSTEYNQQLSERRANNVLHYLEDNLHVAHSRLSAVGYGETSPKADNQTEEGKRQNRRVDGVISCATDVQGLTQFSPRLTTSAVIHYAANKTAVPAESHDDLAKVAAFLKENPSVTATAEGHTDNSNPRNAKKVSTQRAENVVKYLVDNFGVPASQLNAEGFGNSRRVAYDTTAEGRQQNRRVNIVLNYPDTPTPEASTPQ